MLHSQVRGDGGRGGGAVWDGVKIGGTWTQQERRMFINELELFALKLALETFFKAQEIESLHIQMDNIVDLTYFLKFYKFEKKLKKFYKWFVFPNKFGNCY